MTRLGETAVVSGLVGSDKTLERIRKAGRIVLRTFTEDGEVWTIDGVIPALRKDLCAKLVQSGILIPREPEGQSWELAEAWR